MQQSRPEFLAGAGLTRHEHRAFDFSGTLDCPRDPPHGGITAEHPIAGFSTRSGTRRNTRGNSAVTAILDHGIQRAAERFAGCARGTPEVCGYDAHPRFTRGG
jgi:hypothetical protein